MKNYFSDSIMWLMDGIFSYDQSSGKLGTFVEKKRRKNAKKDHKYMPYRRPNEDGQQSWCSCLVAIRWIYIALLSPTIFMETSLWGIGLCKSTFYVTCLIIVEWGELKASPTLYQNIKFGIKFASIYHEFNMINSVVLNLVNTVHDTNYKLVKKLLVR